MSAIPRGDPSLLGRWWWTVDRTLLACIAVLAVFGVVMAFAASPPVASRVGFSELHFVEKHLLFVPLGLALLIVASMASPRGVLLLCAPLLVATLLLVACTLLVGAEIKGARRWLVFGGFNLQPAEFAKPALAVVCGFLLARREGLAGLPAAALPVALLVGLLVLQPDLGTSALVLAAFGVQLFVAGLPWPWIVLAAGGGLAGLAGAYAVFDHVRARIDAFLDPAAEPFQVEAALRAISTGGLFGRGPGAGEVKYYLPEAHSDFVFATMAEEFGILACLAVLGLFAFVVLRALSRLLEAHDRTVLLAGTGLLAQLGLQAFVNMGVNLAILPTKGMTLPFVSYGGSSLLALSLGTGMLLALLRRDARLESA
ncbi:putative peptidoglycan glycosyltransferase FtsW [bacterium HR39]|nr:putative peptidoglycan glycosyltransferase FtsW [bacterium HR39]